MKAEQLTLNNKVGYLNLRTGRYKYVPITKIFGTEIELCEKIKVGRNCFVDNKYNETTERLNKYSNTESIDFKDGRPLLKLK